MLSVLIMMVNSCNVWVSNKIFFNNKLDYSKQLVLFQIS